MSTSRKLISAFTCLALACSCAGALADPGNGNGNGGGQGGPPNSQGHGNQDNRGHQDDHGKQGGPGGHDANDGHPGKGDRVMARASIMKVPGALSAGIGITGARVRPCHPAFKKTWREASLCRPESARGLIPGWRAACRVMRATNGARQARSWCWCRLHPGSSMKLSMARSIETTGHRRHSNHAPGAQEPVHDLFKGVHHKPRL